MSASLLTPRKHCLACGFQSASSSALICFLKYKASACLYRPRTYSSLMLAYAWSWRDSTYVLPVSAPGLVRSMSSILSPMISMRRTNFFASSGVTSCTTTSMVSYRCMQPSTRSWSACCAPSSGTSPGHSSSSRTFSGLLPGTRSVCAHAFAASARACAGCALKASVRATCFRTACRSAHSFSTCIGSEAHHRQRSSPSARASLSRSFGTREANRSRARSSTCL